MHLDDVISGEIGLLLAIAGKEGRGQTVLFNSKKICTRTYIRVLF
jgi:hypothetical protein